MLRANSFKETEIKKAEQLFNKVQYSPRQRQLLVDLASVIHKYVPISELALRGFLLRAAKEYQVTYQTTLLDIEGKSREKRFEALKRGFEYVETSLSKLLKNPQDRETLKQALMNALNYYLEHYE